MAQTASHIADRDCLGLVVLTVVPMRFLCLPSRLDHVRLRSNLIAEPQPSLGCE
jgi:hypothetical protein